MSRRIGVCSWSLQPDSAADLIGKLQAVGLDCCQLHLDPLRPGADVAHPWDAQHAIEELFDAGIEVRSGMMSMAGEDYSTLESIKNTGGIRPDHLWKANLLAAKGNAKVARQIGVELVSFHAGFLPHSQGAERTKLVQRLREITDAFAHEGVRVALETGQESAVTLLGVLAEVERKTLGVNFDPANMILYGMGDPMTALKALAPRVLQVHVKDALPTKTPGTWGTEVPVGEGAVDWTRFFAILREAKNDCDAMVEREAGDDRLKDVKTARERVEHELARIS